jgi:hypothetical protein
MVAMEIVTKNAISKDMFSTVIAQVMRLCPSDTFDTFQASRADTFSVIKFMLANSDQDMIKYAAMIKFSDVSAITNLVAASTNLDDSSPFYRAGIKVSTIKS